MARQALFLDRDGVINVDRGYVHRIDQCEFIPGVFELVTAAHRAGYLVLIVTNQSGIGRGYYTEEQFHALMDWMAAQFSRRGGKIDRVYFCPEHPEHGIGKYRAATRRRKPGPGMLLEAADDFDIDMARSILVGDNPSDMRAGYAANVGRNFLLRQSDEVRSSDPEDDDADCEVVSSLLQLVERL